MKNALEINRSLDELLPQDSLYKCPHCNKWTKKVTKQIYLRGASSGLWQCRECGRKEAAMMWGEVFDD